MIRIALRSAVLSLVCVSAAARAQTVPCQTLRLDNGMTVILHRDPRLPVVAVNLRCGVGAVDEPEGRSGFAHLFEHLMFMGTRRVPANRFDEIMESGGGTNNAVTTEDSTSYFSQGPAELLPTLLWLEADRLEDLGRAMDQEKLDKQRAVVRNEIRETVDNTPYGASEERVFGLMYPAGHPYHDGILGRPEDLTAATVEDVKAFFATFYVPGNLSLAVSGDFDPVATAALVRELFGTLPRGAPVPRRAPVSAALDHVVRATLLDRVELPRIKMAWHGPARFADGDAEMELLGEVLSDGKSSRLYQRLVERDRLAVDVAAYQDAFEMGSLFQIDVTAASGADLDAIERAVDEELARLREGGVSADELEPRQAVHELKQLAGLQSNAAIAAQLNAYQAAFGAPDSFARDLERYRSVTPDSVLRWARSVLDPGARCIIRVLPIAPAHVASARDRRPEPAPASAFDPPSPERFELDNGIEVRLWRRPDLPLVSVWLQAATGGVLTEPATAGLARLTAAMLREGAGERDAAAFAAAMQRCGAWFWSGADHESATVAVTALARHLASAVALMADAVRRPRLAAEDWERLQSRQEDWLRARQDDPDAVADRVALRLLFGAGNPYGWPSSGTLATVGALTLDDVRQEHARLFAPCHLTVFAAGDVTAARLRDILGGAFGDWRPAAPAERPAPGPAEPAAAAGLRVAIVDRPGAVQTVIRLVTPAPPWADPRRVPYEVLGTVLGGTFDSRLNRVLREERGYSYGAGARFWMSPFAGTFTAWTSVQTDSTGAAVQDLLAQLGRLRAAGGGDVTAAEVDRARATLRAGVIASFATLTGLIETARQLELNGVPMSALRDDLHAMETVSAQQLNALSGAALPLDRGVLVLVGDADAIEGQVRAAGWPETVRVDAEGGAVGR